MNEDRKILVADDDPDIRTILKKILDEQNWYDCEIFPHYIDLKSRTLKVKPSLLILDIHYQDSSIIDFLKFRENDPNLSKVPVLILSSEKNKDIINEVMTYNVAEYIMKPIIPNELITIIERIFKKYDIKEISTDINIDISVPISFTKASETLIIGESILKLKANQTYNISCEYLEKVGVKTDQFITSSESTISAESENFETVFKTRGTSESFLSKIRSDKL